MGPVANSLINSWNSKLKTPSDASTTLGLIAASFDQWNHGSRAADEAANGHWRGGNENHAQEMLGIYHGTAADILQLITYLPSYIFLTLERTLVDHMVLGVSFIFGRTCFTTALGFRNFTLGPNPTGLIF